MLQDRAGPGAGDLQLTADSGHRFQDHLQIRAIYQTRDPITLEDRLRNPFKKALMGLAYAPFRSGSLTMGASQVCIFEKTSKGLETPDIQYHVQPCSAGSPGEGTHRFPAFTMSVCQLRSESRGQISLKSPDPRDATAIEPNYFSPNYLSTETERRVAVDSNKFAQQPVQSSRLAPPVAEEICFGSAERESGMIGSGGHFEMLGRQVSRWVRSRP